MGRLTENLPMPAGYFDLTLRQLGTTPQAAAALLDGTGVSPAHLAEPDAEITLGQQLRQLRNASRTFPPGWALGIGRAFQPSTHGPVGVAAVSAPTLGAALDVLQRFCHVRHPSYRARARQQGTEFRLELEECCALLEEERLPLIEMFLLSFQGIVEAVLGRPMTEGCFEIALPAPSYAGCYRDYFHAEVQFDARATAIVIPAEWRKLRCPFADRAMYAAASTTLIALARRLDGLDYTAARVEQLMTTNGDPGLPLAEAALLLGVSRRTLGRRLQEAGTTYEFLRDSHRRQRAEALLRERSLTATEVASRLGYADPANFARACRRWFGSSPGRLRQKDAGATVAGASRKANAPRP